MAMGLYFLLLPMLVLGVALVIVGAFTLKKNRSAATALFVAGGVLTLIPATALAYVVVAMATARSY